MRGRTALGGILGCAMLAAASAALGAAGELDASFGSGGVSIVAPGPAYDLLAAMALQGDGKVVVAGRTLVAGKSVMAMARFDATGTLDASFGNGGFTTVSFGSQADFATSVIVQPDGRVVAAGKGNGEFALVRLTPSGELDPSFDGDGRLTTVIGAPNGVNALALQPDGKLLAVAGVGPLFTVVRYLPDGALDASFDGDGKVQVRLSFGFGDANAVALQPDGKLVVAGYATVNDQIDVAVMRLHSNGSLDLSFSDDGKLTTAIATVGLKQDQAASVLVQPDGKIVVGGSACGLRCVMAVVRYNADGSLDTGFSGDGVQTVATIGEIGASTLLLQPDGRLILAGGASSATPSDFALARLDASGTLDPSFASAGLVTTSISPGTDFIADACVLPNGSVLVAGNAEVAVGYDWVLARYLGDPRCGDGRLASPEQCDDGNTSGGDCCSAECQFEAAASPCASDGEPCSVDACDGNGACAHLPGNATAVCRGAVDACDMVEVCDGISIACPADGVAAEGTTCRAAIDACDATETCDGRTPVCAADGALPPGTVCRAAAGSCDLAEHCDGHSRACPADAHSVAVCRAAAGPCDIEERCDGGGDDCPADALAAPGSVCRAAAGPCDASESCGGTSRDCPADLPAASGPCDDGNACTESDTCVDGECVGGAPRQCDDGNPCTTDSCAPSGGCRNDAAPADGCLAAGSGLLRLRHTDPDRRDQLLWKWGRGGPLTLAELGNPTQTTRYALCVYAGPAPAPVLSASLPSGVGWSATGTRGYRFRGTGPDGLSRAGLTAGAPGRSRALVQGKGGALPEPSLPFDLPVTVQLRRVDSPLCLESVFSAADVTSNDAQRFKAKH